MTAKQLSQDTRSEEASAIKRKLAWRMGIAGLMIAGLLAGLAVLDRLGTSTSREAEAPQFSGPVPVAKKMVTQPVTPVEPPVSASQAEPVAEPESSKAPANSGAALAEPPPRPEVAAQPTLPQANSAAVTATGNRSRLNADATLANAAPARLMTGYVLQAGVFSDTQHAEELHARLIREGYAASIEARVQVGPFKDRKEAEAVRKKLSALGVDSVLLPPRRKR